MLSPDRSLVYVNRVEQAGYDIKTRSLFIFWLPTCLLLSLNLYQASISTVKDLIYPTKPDPRLNQSVESAEP
jgi:hypothetical protein